MAAWNNSDLVSTQGSTNNYGVALIGTDDSYATTNSYVARKHYKVFGASKVTVSLRVTGVNAADFKVSLSNMDTSDDDPDNLVFVDDYEKTSIGSATTRGNSTITLYPQNQDISGIKVWVKSSVTDSPATAFLTITIVS